MAYVFKSEIGRLILALLLLLGFKAVQTIELPEGTTRKWSSTLFSTLSSRELNTEAREALTAGYYEGLMNEGSRLSSMNRLVTDSRRPTWEDRAQPDRRQTNTFLYYEFAPNSDLPDYRDERARYRRKTNSHGFADHEYSLEKPPATRRIAVMGDSITQGQGAPFGGNYESLLELKLNDAHVSPQVHRYEVLNFAVGSYNITQQLEAAKVKAAPYRPDVYVFGISQLSVYRRWGHHIALLMYSGIDLKYDYLKNMAQEAGLDARDPIGVFDAKLARFRLPTIRWTLSEMKAYVAAQDARMIVLLIPTGNYPEQLVEPFLGVRDILADLNIPTIDLLDTFAGVDNILDIKVGVNDGHPNKRGHQMIFEHLYHDIASDPRLAEIVLGTEYGG